eukprot:1160380-Pelagomonas_calceolata.AAC.1
MKFHPYRAVLMFGAGWEHVQERVSKLLRELSFIWGRPDFRCRLGAYAGASPKSKQSLTGPRWGQNPASRIPSHGTSLDKHQRVGSMKRGRRTSTVPA